MSDTISVEKKSKKLKEKRRRQQRKERRKVDIYRQLSEVQTSVAEIHFQGIQRTNMNFLYHYLQPVFQAGNYNQVMDRVQILHKDLKLIGCFKKVNVTLCCNEDDKDKLDLEVKVEELPRWQAWGDLRTSDLNCLDLGLYGSAPNVFGGGESVRLEVGKGLWTKMERQKLAFYKSIYVPRIGHTIFSTDLSRNRRLNFQNLLQTDHLTQFRAIMQPTNWLQNSLGLNLAHRQLSPGRGADLTFSNRLECGHSVKSSVFQELIVDNRLDRVLPWSGYLIKQSQVKNNSQTARSNYKLKYCFLNIYLYLGTYSAPWQCRLLQGFPD